MKSIFLIYLIAAISFKLWKWWKYSEIEERIPKNYIDDFKECVIKKSSLFDKGEEIPQEIATILIIGNIRTKNRTVIALDHLANFLSFGWIRFNEILPVGEPLSLRLYFKNISKADIEVQGGSTHFFIKYPGESTPSRNWRMDIPNLPHPSDSCFVDSEFFFSPEVPGTHEFQIQSHDKLVCAAPYGVCDRRYRIPIPGAPWLFRFHVSSGYEYKTFIVAFIALAVAIFSLIASFNK